MYEFELVGLKSVSTAPLPREMIISEAPVADCRISPSPPSPLTSPHDFQPSSHLPPQITLAVARVTVNRASAESIATISKTGWLVVCTGTFWGKKYAFILVYTGKTVSV